MATSRIKGITVEIGGDTTGLDKALKGVNDTIGGTQTALKDIDRLLKLDPTNTELLRQKQENLKDAISATKEKLDTLKTASEQAAQTAGNYDAWKEKYDPIKAQIDETNKQLKKLKEQSAEAEKQLAEGKISQEKYDAIQTEVRETEERLKGLKERAQAVDEEFGHPVSPERYDALQREIIATEQNLQRLQQEAVNSSEALVKIGEAGKTLQSVGDKISDVGETLTTRGTKPLVEAGTVAVTKFAEVDKTMALANQTMGNTEEKARLLNTAMSDAAANSTFGMTDAATATLNFARAGLTAEEAASALAPAMNLAAGEGGKSGHCFIRPCCHNQWISRFV